MVAAAGEQTSTSDHTDRVVASSSASGLLRLSSELLETFIDPHKPAILALIERLNIFTEIEYPDGPPFVDPDADQLAGADLAGLFRGLAAVEEVRVTAGWPIVGAAVSALSTLESVPYLSTLYLNCDFPRWEDRLNSQWWHFLADRPRLHYFSLQVWADEDADSPLPPPRPTLRPFPPLTSVSISYFSDSNSTPASYFFGELLPNVTSLELAPHDGYEENLISLFCGLPNPDQLVSFTTPACHEPEHLTALANCTSLDCLTIDRGWVHDEFYSVLRQLPTLSSLTFLDKTLPLDAGLLRLFDGDEKHPTLKHLEIGSLGGLRGCPRQRLGAALENGARPVDDALATMEQARD
ncbi:hypothetical protein JCM11641_001535 [Rhodosporidiobolus odoratus]